MEALILKRISISKFIVVIVSILSVSILLATASTAARERRIDVSAGVNRFAGKTVTIALPGFAKAGVAEFRDQWQRESGARLQVIKAD